MFIMQECFQDYTAAMITRKIGEYCPFHFFVVSQIYTAKHIFTLSELFPSPFFAFDLMLKFGLT